MKYSGMLICNKVVLLYFSYYGVNYVRKQYDFEEKTFVEWFEEEEMYDREVSKEFAIKLETNFRKLDKLQ